MCATTLELTHVLTIESSKALLELHKAENISRWCSEASLVNGFWTIGSSVTISLANVLIEQKDLTSNQIQVLLTHLEAILRSRNEFLQQANMTRQPDPTSRELRSAASTKLEIALSLDAHLQWQARDRLAVRLVLRSVVYRGRVGRRHGR